MNDWMVLNNDWRKDMEPNLIIMVENENWT